MSNQEITFKELVVIYKAANFGDSTSDASVKIINQDLCDIITHVTEQPKIYGITIEKGNVAVGENVTLHIEPPKLRLGQLHYSFDDYIKNSKNRIKEPSNFFIINLKYHNRDTKKPDLLAKYQNILRLISLFKECSAYLDETNAEFVFVGSDVLKIPVNYTLSDIEKVDNDLIKSLIANFAEDTHREQKLTILANSIKSLCESKSKDTSFSFMLSDLNQIYESFQKGYKVYVSGFSYEKILDQLRVAKIEEMGKIHKVFSDIQNQILSIPVATIIVATQMKQANNWDAQALINTAVVIGSLFFIVMITFTLFNQWQTLIAISDELSYKKQQAENNYKAIYTDINATFDSLTQRLLIQKAIFIAIGIFIVVGLYLTLKFYFFLTPHATNYISNSTRYICDSAGGISNVIRYTCHSVGYIYGLFK